MEVSYSLEDTTWLEHTAAIGSVDDIVPESNVRVETRDYNVLLEVR